MAAVIDFAAYRAAKHPAPAPVLQPVALTEVPGKPWLSIGTEIYYTGDAANHEGFGVITKIEPATTYGPVQIHIDMEDGRTPCLTPSAFSPTYSGNGSTRWVTKAAYNAWREERMAEWD